MRVKDIIGKTKNSVDMKKNIANIVKHADVSEKMIERYLCDSIKEMGGVCLKYSNAGMVGYPDRIVMLPGGWTVWVELKSKGKKLTYLQSLRYEVLKGIGQRVYVADSRDKVDEIINDWRKSYENKM